MIPTPGEEATLHADMFGMNPDVAYGPWLVVNRRRNTNKSPKKGPSPDKNLLHKQDKTNFFSGSLSKIDPTTLVEGKAKGKLAYPHVWKGPKTPHLVISFRPI